MKKFFITLLAIGLVAGTTACTSSDDAGEATDDAEFAEDATSEISDVASEGSDEFGSDEFGSDEFGDFDEEGAEGGGDEFAADDTADDSADDSLDSAFDDAIAESEPLEEGSEEDAFAEDASDELAGLEDDSFESSDADSSTDDLLDDSVDTASTDSAFSDDYSSDELSGLGTDDSGYAEESTPAYKPLNKMLSTPYRKNGVVVNAIYIARQGDTIDGIASKIYGTDKTDELKSLNGHLAARDVVTGDKIYYNSPQRPNDESQIKVYYEDLGLAPETYVSQPGDNIRGVGKQLLGDDRSWKELWATNMDVESKGALDEGTSLRYWMGDGGAQAIPPAPAAVAQVDEPETQFNEPPPPPPMEEPVEVMPDEAPEFAQAEPPPPPPMEEPPAFEPPPPPPPQESMAIAEAPAPPPPVMEANNDQATSGSVDELMAGDDTMTMIAGAIFILAAVAMFIVIRKRKAKKNIEFHTATHTQLE